MISPLVPELEEPVLPPDELPEMVKYCRLQYPSWPEVVRTFTHSALELSNTETETPCAKVSTRS